MATWILVPCLVSLRNQFNALAPNRDKASDGSIGDTAHANSSSDHNPDETGATPYEDSDSTNEVHAIDVDKELNLSGWSMQKAVEIIVTRHRSGQDNRLQNVIYNRRIWSASWGWTAREYTGSNPHNEHAHFSSKYDAAKEADTRPWGLLEKEDDMPLTNTDVDKVVDGLLVRDLGKPGGGDTVGVALQSGFQASTKAARDAEAALAAIKALKPADASALASLLLPQIKAEMERQAVALQGRFDSLYQEINEVPREVMNAIANPDTPDEDVARVLREVLGGRTAAIAALMQR